METDSSSSKLLQPNRRQFLLTTSSTVAAGVIAACMPSEMSGRLINEFTSLQPGKKESKMKGTKPSIVFCHGLWADGRIWLLPDGIDSFAGDLSEQEKKLVWATQCVPAPDLFEAKVGGTAWRSKPS